MTDEEAANLVKRVDELEQSNKALWAWVKALANQDTMLLEFSRYLLDRSEDWAPQREKIAKDIFENASYIHNSFSKNADE